MELSLQFSIRFIPPALYNQTVFVDVRAHLECNLRDSFFIILETLVKKLL